MNHDRFGSRLQRHFGDERIMYGTSGLAAEEVKSDVDARIPYKPLKPGHAKPLKPRGKPYTRPAQICATVADLQGILQLKHERR
ncbi:hypothetical protein ACLOJK_033060, partial [Asimina triloba]